MANLNKVILIGRLTRDPETRSFANGGMVAKIGFAVTNRRKNTQTGNWEDEPMFIDVEVFNRGEFGKTADLVRDRCRKGSQVMIEGKLHLDQWDDKTTGQKRTKHKLIADNIQLLDTRTDGTGGGGRPATSNMGGGGYSSPPMDDGMGYDPGPDHSHSSSPSGGNAEDIPF